MLLCREVFCGLTYGRQLQTTSEHLRPPEPSLLFRPSPKKKTMSVFFIIKLLKLIYWFISCISKLRNVFIRQFTVRSVPPYTSVCTSVHNCLYLSTQLSVPQYTSFCTSVHICLYLSIQLFASQYTTFRCAGLWIWRKETPCTLWIVSVYRNQWTATVSHEHSASSSRTAASCRTLIPMTSHPRT